MNVRRARRFALLILAVVVMAAAGRAADEGVDGVAGALSETPGRRPRPGEWMEYRVAFPIDPLENLLAARPAAPPVREGGGMPAPAGEDAGWGAIRPMVEPETAWRVLPLRIEMREMDDDGFNAEVTFAGMTRQVRVPASDPGPKADFHYDDDKQPSPPKTVVRLGDRDVLVETVTRRADGYGFTRQTNPELPFGLFRFATGNVDLILVGTGYGRPPDFPLPEPEAIRPPSGTLFD